MDARINLTAKSWRYKLVKFKAYFEKGESLTHYVKYLIAFLGLASRDALLTLIIGLIYVPVCFIIGWYWLNDGWLSLEIEVSNEFNWFVRQMRQHITKRKP